MTSDLEVETNKSSSMKATWITYVIVCLVLIFVLGIIFTPAISDHGIPASSARAQAVVSLIETACMAYKIEYGAFPSTSENYRLVKILTTDNPRGIAFINVKSSDLTPNGDLIDPWKTPVRITFDSNSKVHAASAGPDKVFGTPDDVTNQP